MNDCPASEDQTESNEFRPPDQLGFFVQSESLDSMRKSWHSKFAFFTHFALLLFGVGVAHAQIGGFDPSFITGPILGAGTNASVRAMAVQTNGYVIVAGDFTSIGGAQRNRIARLTSTGALDASFTPQSGADGPIHAVVLQSDGKILIGGEFTTYNGVSRNRIARLTSNGSLDTTFDPGIGANGTVRAIALGSSSYYFNGYGASILIGGDFTSVGGATRNRIAQLSATGALDTSFNPGSGANDTVYAIVVSGNYYPSGIYVGGAFTSFNGQTRNRLVKLSAYGSVDYSFNSGVGLDGAVYALALVGDTYSSSAGLYAGGNFTSVDGVVRGRIARFTVSSYGFGSSIDQNFNVWTDAPVRAFVTEGDSYSRQAKILIAGDFTLVNGVSKNRLARLLVGSDYYYGPFGSSAYANLDTTFNPSPGINNSVFASAKLPDGRTLIGGAFDQVSGNSTSGLARLYGDFGSSLPDAPSALRSSPASNTQVILDWGSTANASGYKIERSLDGITDWTQISSSSSPYADNGLSPGTTYFYRVRASNYNGDGPYSSIVSAATDTSAWTGPGSLDPSTGPNSGPNSTVNAIVRQSDGKIVVVGSFSQVAGIARKYIARLNADWTLDTDFDPGIGPNSSINAVAVQADGKILIGGDFSTVNGVTRKYIARLTNTGSLDATFDPGIGPNSSVEAINTQADGKSLVGGWFSTFNGYSQEYIARLNTDGSLDMEYRTTPNSIVYSIEIQSDGRAIIGGSFSTVNGVSKTGIARINMDGSLDLAFNNGTGAMSVKDLFIQIDGKILLCGGFSTFNGVSRKYVARLDSSGALDTTFDPGTGPNSSLECVAVDAQGNVVIGGYFTDFSVSNRFRIARLNIDGTLDATFRPGIGMNSVVNSILIQPDTKIVVGGSFTTIGGVTANYLARLNGGVSGQLMITGPEITILDPRSQNLSSGGDLAGLPPTLAQNQGTPVSITIRNDGDASLSQLSLSKNGSHPLDFQLSALGQSSLAPGQTTNLTVTFSPTAGGNRSSRVLISSNDADENPFLVNISGFGLSTSNDSDGDGLNDAAEFKMTALGFDWQLAQSQLVASLFDNASTAGLHTTSQVQSMNIAVPLISKNATSGKFELTIGLRKSTNLQTFQHFSLNNTETTIEPDGRLKIRFSVPDNAAFFRLQAEK